MKIDVITFHNTSNFGATLQCSALSHYLKGRGFDVEVIDYLPEYVLNKKSAMKELKKVGASKNKAKAFVKGLAYSLHAGEIKRREAKFERFIGENLALSKPYHTYESLQADPPRADFYICGSDQIWNPALTGGALDEAFFLQFAQGSKASYGASMGELDIEGHAAELRRLTDNFANISVRERSVAERLSKAVGKEVRTVLDCTLLLDKEAYAEMEQDPEVGDKPYLLFYSLQRSGLCDDLARKIAKEKNLSVIDISPNPFLKLDGAKKRIDIGPGEFLTLFRNASFVVTNSFHGTVFSIIYEKPFYSIPHSIRAGRVVDLLEALDLRHRIVQDMRDADEKAIDYAAVRDALHACREQSFAYLHETLARS